MNRTEVTDVVCVEDWKYALLAQSCMCLGFTPLVLNLLRSVASPNFDLVEEPWRRVSDSGSKSIRPLTLFGQEYLFGASFETYPIPCPSRLDGLTFLEVAFIIYEASRGRVFLWGLQVRLRMLLSRRCVATVAFV